MALLTRGRGPSPSVPRDPEARMSVIEHLEALRRALIISIAAWALLTLAAWFFSAEAVTLLIHRAGLNTVVYLSPTGAFLLRFKVALYVGFVAAAPVIFWQLWWFVSPGLYRHEKRIILPLIAATSAFFLLGVGFALFALPLFMRVLTSFAPPDLHFLPVGDDLLSFVLALVIAFGIVFEMPVILWTLGMLRIITTRWLYKNHAYWIVGLGLLANVMTPGLDPLTPLIVFIPLVFFWEATALLLKLSGR
jgi:sec-independent protein translocase protein TatC